MTLALFLIDLMQSGQVTVPTYAIDFQDSKDEEALVLLEEYHRLDSLNMPYAAPAFDPQAAIWAARYLFNAIQFVLLRDLGEERIVQLLKEFPHQQNPEAIYSADLTLRFLPAIFKFASGISPADPLIFNLKTTCEHWPFSSVGTPDLTCQTTEKVLDHPALRAEYMDRIILQKDLSRLKGVLENNLLTEILGDYRNVLWPELNLIQPEKIS